MRNSLSFDARKKTPSPSTSLNGSLISAKLAVNAQLTQKQG